VSVELVTISKAFVITKVGGNTIPNKLLIESSVICYPADEQDLRFRIKSQRWGPWALPYTTLKE